ncbi:solute carrier family 2 member 11, like [Amia ocellicauda]|uniref:solute carrier family 2 member 11, like n=1 Tax=Amia ocellicauda TaxID=2972642 RepID=UPI003464D3B9
MAHALLQLFESPMLVVAIFVFGIGGNFQYGFQVSVLNSPSSYIKQFVNETCQSRYDTPLESWKLSLIWSFIVSIFSIGGLIGSLSIGPFTIKYGRKKCLWLNNLVAIAAAVMMWLSRTAASFEMIMIGRFLYGINAGVSLNIHTMYIAECAPKRLRGIVGVTASSFVSTGKFFGQLIGLEQILGKEEMWPMLLAFSGLTALIQMVTLPFFPESPRYLLIDRGDRAKCEEAVRKLWRKVDHVSEIEEMLGEHAAIKGVKSRSTLELICDKTMRWQLLTVMVTFVTLQLCGINAIYLYSFDVFRAAGIPHENMRYVVLGTGLSEVVTNLACIMVIESTGRRVLMYRNYLCMSLVLGLLTIALFLQKIISWMPYCSMVLVFTFIFFFSSGPAGVTAPLPGEIFNQSFKPAAFGIACGLNWIGLFIIGMVFPFIVEYLGYFCFLFFLGFCFFTGVFVWFNVPETKNRTVLEITEEFRKMHTKTKDKVVETLDGIESQITIKDTKL